MIQVIITTRFAILAAWDQALIEDYLRGPRLEYGRR